MGFSFYPHLFEIYGPRNVENTIKPDIMMSEILGCKICGSGWFWGGHN